MLFNSIIFLIFASLFFLIDHLVGKKVRLRQLWIVIASFTFYGWWDWRFIFLILFSGFVDYIAAAQIESQPRRKKFWLVLSLITNIGSLSIFKYSGFIAHTLDTLFNIDPSRSLYSHLPEFSLITPVGISFYTFQSMSYTIDIYKGRMKASKNIIHFFAYLSMFPQLVAGPIVRACDMLPQLNRVRKVHASDQWSGMELIVRGFFKKLVIADNLAPFVVTAFSAPDINPSTGYWWVVMLAFTFQIYCDFAGYSDIARGLAKWMGLDFPDNFKHPYTARSMHDFWSKWHISLSTWFRDYLYIPLGGSRKGKFRTHLNLWITMLVSGLWHGASWTYVLWGASHAFFSSFEKLSKWPQYLQRFKVGNLIASGLVLIQVVVAFTFFRAESVEQAFEIIQQMFAFENIGNFAIDLNTKIFLLIIILRELYIASGIKTPSIHPYAQMVWYAILITIVVYFRGNGSEFIYFQF